MRRQQREILKLEHPHAKEMFWLSEVGDRYLFDLLPLSLVHVCSFLQKLKWVASPYLLPKCRLFDLEELYSRNASCGHPGSEFSGGIQLSAKFKQQEPSSSAFLLSLGRVPCTYWLASTCPEPAKSCLVSRQPQPSPHLSWSSALHAELFRCSGVEGLRWTAAFGPIWGFHLLSPSFQLTSWSQTSGSSGMFRLPVLLMVFLIVQSCRRAALKNHVRDWLPGFGLQVPPYCQPSPQQCSSSWALVSRCRGSGIRAFL